VGGESQAVNDFVMEFSVSATKNGMGIQIHYRLSSLEKRGQKR